MNRLLTALMIILSCATLTGAAAEVPDPGDPAYAEWASQRLEQASRDDNRLEMARGHFHLARHQASLGLYPQAEMQARMAVELLPVGADRELATQIDLLLVSVLTRMERGSEIIDQLLAMIEDYDRTGQHEAAIRARMTLTPLMSQVRDFETARQLSLTALESAIEHDLVDWHTRLLINLIRIETDQNPEHDGQPWLDMVSELDQSRLQSQTRLSLMLVRIFFARQQGRIDDAIALLQEAGQQAEALDDSYLNGYVALHLGEVYCQQGRLDDALDSFRAGEEHFMDSGTLAIRGQLLLNKANCLASQDRFEQAWEIQQRGQALVNQANQNEQAQAMAAGMLAFNTERNLNEIERLNAKQLQLSSSLERRRWQAVALLVFCAFLVALAGILWARSRHQAEREATQRELARHRIDLLARTSHEIRNPAQGLLGLLERANTRQSPTLSPAELGSTLAGTQLITRLANDYLDLALIEQQRLQVDSKATCHLPRLLEQIKSLAERMPQGARGLLETSISDDLPEWIHCDSERLTQVLLNGLGNSFRHGGLQPVKLSVRPGRNGEEIEFEIRDQGPGFADTSERLFDVYWKSRTMKPGSSGIGLAISAEIVRLLGGRIRAENLKPRGARLVISLPLRRVEGKLGAPGGNTILLNRFAGTRLAIIDDDRFAASGLAAISEALGCQVKLLNSADRLEALLDDHDPDLILLDHNLISSDGLSVASRIRQHDRERQRPLRRIIMVSGSAAPARADQATHDAWQLKPMSMRDLARHLKQLQPA